MSNHPLPECIARITKIEAALNDNGSWGIKTKVARMWDFYIRIQPTVSKRDEQIKILHQGVADKVDTKDCIVVHEKLLKDVKEILEKRETEEANKKKIWRWWFEQLRWLTPYAAAFYMWITTQGGQ